MTAPAAPPAPALEHVRVRDAMHPGAFTCRADTPLKDVVAIMAHYRVHALVVLEADGHRLAGLITDRDVLAAAHRVTGTAAQAAAAEPVTISAGERLSRAARVMADHDVGHLIVLDPTHGHPIGMLSTLDIAAVIATGRVDG